MLSGGDVVIKSEWENKFLEHPQIFQEYTKLATEHKEFQGMLRMLSEAPTGTTPSAVLPVELPQSQSRHLTEYDNIDAAKAAHKVMYTGRAAPKKTEVLVTETKDLLLLSQEDVTLPKGTLLGGFGGGQYVQRAPGVSDGVVSLSFAKGDKTLVQFEKSDGTFSTETLYSAVRTLDRAGKHNISLQHFKKPLQITAAGIELVANQPFQDYKVKYTQEGDPEMKAKDAHGTVFAPVASHGFPSGGAVAVAFRLRLDSTNNVLKPQKPYLVLQEPVTLHKGKPLLVTGSA